jgi:hypothetical protein
MDAGSADEHSLCVEVGALVADGAAIDALARVALVARRCGYAITLRDPSPALVQLIELAGLSEALPAERLSLRSKWPRC